MFLLLLVRRVVLWRDIDGGRPPELAFLFLSQHSNIA